MSKKCLSISYSALGKCITKKFVKINGIDRIVSFNLDYDSSVCDEDDVLYSYDLMNTSV